MTAKDRALQSFDAFDAALMACFAAYEAVELAKGTDPAKVAAEMAELERERESVVSTRAVFSKLPWLPEFLANTVQQAFAEGIADMKAKVAELRSSVAEAVAG